jgi:hypothetical protein
MKTIETIDWKKVGFTAALGVGGYFASRKFIGKTNMASIGGVLIGGAIGFFTYDMIFKNK